MPTKRTLWLGWLLLVNCLHAAPLGAQPTTPTASVEDLLFSCYRGWSGAKAGVFTWDATARQLRPVCACDNAVWAPDHRHFVLTFPEALGIVTPSLDVNEGTVRFGKVIQLEPAAWFLGGRNDVAWSPDSRTLALVGSDHTSPSSRFIALADFAKVLGEQFPFFVGRVHMSEGETAYDPSFSPDGTYLAFIRSEGAPGLTTLTSALAWARRNSPLFTDPLPPVTPRNGEALPPLRPDAERGLVTIDLEPGRFSCRQPDWSPDSAKIGYTRFDLVKQQYDACWVDIASKKTGYFKVPYETAKTRNSSQFVGWMKDGQALITVGPPGMLAGEGPYLASETAFRRLAQEEMIVDAVVSADGTQAAWISTDHESGDPGNRNTVVDLFELATGTVTHLFIIQQTEPLGADANTLVPYQLAW